MMYNDSIVKFYPDNEYFTSNTIELISGDVIHYEIHSTEDYQYQVLRVFEGRNGTSVLRFNECKPYEKFSTAIRKCDDDLIEVMNKNNMGIEELGKASLALRSILICVDDMKKKYFFSELYKSINKLILRSISKKSILDSVKKWYLYKPYMDRVERIIQYLLEIEDSKDGILAINIAYSAIRNIENIKRENDKK